MEKSKDEINIDSPWYYFHSQGCAFCKKLDPIIDELNEEGHEILILDMVENDNKQLYNELQQEYKKKCGTPWLVNAETGKDICGYRDKTTILKWLSGEDIPAPIPPTGPMPRPPFQNSNKKEEKKWISEYNIWADKNKHLPNILSADDILAKPRPKSQPPQFPHINASEDVYLKFKEDWDNWAKDNQHMPGIQDGDSIVNRLKQRPKPQNVNSPDSNLENRLTSLEEKMNKLLLHLGVK